jgi:cytochrome c biogenesis protein
MQYREAAHGHGEAILLVLFPPDSQPEGFWLLKSVSEVKDMQVGGFSFIIKDLEKKDYTVLEVVHDPGVPVVWVGCSLLVIGMVVTFTLRRPPKRTSPQER